jgi:hypothetical protein
MTSFALAAGGAALGAGSAFAQDRETPGVEFAFEVHALLEPGVDIGQTSRGGRRRIPIIGGTFEGARIKGKVVPGGMDWQLMRTDGVTEVEADYMIQADDGAMIHVYNHGIIVRGQGAAYVRTSPQFEAPVGPHDWLNKNRVLGTIAPGDPGLASVRIGVWRVT